MVQTLWVLTLVERERDEWQRPADIMQWLNVKEGSVVVDLGCGAGYLALKLSPIVGTRGLEAPFRAHLAQAHLGPATIRAASREE